jgi:hypothetical protein
MTLANGVKFDDGQDIELYDNTGTNLVGTLAGDSPVVVYSGVSLIAYSASAGREIIIQADGDGDTTDLYLASSSVAANTFAKLRVAGADVLVITPALVEIDGSLQVGSASLTLPTGAADVIQINESTAPSGTPTGSSVIFCEDGYTKSLDTNGNITALKPNEMGEVYMEGNATATTIAVGSTFYKVAGTTTLGHAHEFDMPANNRLRYTGAFTRAAHIGCTLSVSSGTANQVIQCKIYKNGSAITGSLIETKLGSGGDVTSTAIHVMAEMATNDYIELYVANITAANDVTVKHYNLFMVTMPHGTD